MTPKRILVLSGSPTRGLLYRHILERLGVVAVVVGSIDDAVADLVRTPSDAVLADVPDPAGLSRLRGGTAAPLVVVGGGPSPVADAHAAADGTPEEIIAGVIALVHDRETAPRSTDVFGRARLLIVDDSVTYREYLRLELEAEGCRVAIARDSAEAVGSLDADDFDCVIIDLIMPGVGGDKLCESLDRFRRRRGLFFQIIILTSQEGDGQLMASLRAGADDFIGKSRPLEVFKTRLMALLRRKYLVEDTLRRRLGGAGRDVSLPDGSGSITIEGFHRRM